MVRVTASQSPAAGRYISNEPLITPFRLLYDTAEGAPWTFQGIRSGHEDDWRPYMVRLERRHLKTGDYSIEGCEDWLTIERKSVEDLFGSIGGRRPDDPMSEALSRRERFAAEHERMVEMICGGGTACVIIEGSLDDMMESPPGWSEMDPSSVLGTVASWPNKYGVPWYFAGSVRWAEQLAFRILRLFWERYQEQGGDLWDKGPKRGGK